MADVSVSTKLPRWLRIAALIAAGLGGLAALLYGLSFTAILPGPLRSQRTAPAPVADRDEGWRADLRYLQTEFARLHANAFTKISREQWDADFDALYERVPDLSDEQIGLEMTRIVAQVGDGHSRVYYFEQAALDYPLGLYWYVEGLFVVSATEEYSSAIGAQVLAIEGRPIEEIRAAIVPLISTDNEANILAKSPTMLTNPDALAAVGVIEAPGPATFTLAYPGQDAFALEITPVDPSFYTFDSFLRPWDVNPDLLEPPYVQNQTVDYWFTYAPEAKAIYFQYNACVDNPDYPFEVFAADLFAEAEAQGAERIVVDLRRNGGGNSAVIEPFLEGLRERPQYSQPDRLYALIGRGTFSSAMWNAIDLRELGGTLVGEPTGGKPNAYGETRGFTLPNSGLYVQYSTRYWERVPELGDAPSVLPDINLPRSALDYFAGVDPVLETAFGLR